MNKLESYSATRKLFVRIRTVLLFRIENSQRLWYLFSRVMMITDYQVETFRSCKLHLFNSLDPAIKGNDHFAVTLPGIFKSVERNTVTFFVPVRYVIIHVGILLL